MKEPGYQLTVAVLVALLVWAMLSWASAPASVSYEHDKFLEAQQQVTALKTQIAAVPRMGRR